MRVARTQADAVAMGVLAHARLATRMVSFRKALLEVAMSESRVHATCAPVRKWPRRLSVIAVEDDPAQMVSAPTPPRGAVSAHAPESPTPTLAAAARPASETARRHATSARRDACAQVQQR